MNLLGLFGSGGRTRTYNQRINSPIFNDAKILQGRRHVLVAGGWQPWIGLSDLSRRRSDPLFKPKDHEPGILLEALQSDLILKNIFQVDSGGGI